MLDFVHPTVEPPVVPSTLPHDIASHASFSHGSRLKRLEILELCYFNYSNPFSFYTQSIFILEINKIYNPTVFFNKNNDNYLSI